MNPIKGMKRGKKEQREDGANRKQNSKLKHNISIITLNVSCLKILSE